MTKVCVTQIKMKSEIFFYALRNLWARKSRSFLTVLSILIGITAIFIFASFGLGLYGYVNEIAEKSGIDKFIIQVNSLGAPGLDDSFVLDDSDLKAVEKTKGVKEAVYFYMKPGKIEKNKEIKYVFLIGHSPDTRDIKLVEELMTVDIEKGRQLRKGDKKKVVLGNNYQLEDKIFSKSINVGEKILINDNKFEVVGFYESIGNPGDDANIYILEDDVKDLFGENATYAMLFGSVLDVEKIDSTLDRVKKNLRKERGLDEGEEDFYVQSYAEALEMFTSILNIIVGFIFLIVIISGVVASVNTANTMVTSVLERTKEIGVMKSIGAVNSEIRNIFLLESSIIGFFAGVFGVVLGWFLSSIGGNLLIDLGWSFLAPDFHWSIFAASIALATIVGAISGMAPAIYASKQKPVDALRYE